MELTLGEAQRDPRDTVARFCSSRFGLERLASREGAPVDRGAWREQGDLGIAGMLLPEAERHPDVRAAAVVGRADRRLGDAVPREARMEAAKGDRSRLPEVSPRRPQMSPGRPT